MAADVRTQYPAHERKERRRDKILGTAVGGSAVGLSSLDANTRPGSLSAIKRAGQGASLQLGGRSYPKTARTLARLKATKGPGWKGVAGGALLGLTAAGGRHVLREPEPKQFVAKAGALTELKSQTLYGLPSHQVQALSRRQRSEALVRSIPDPALPLVAPKGEKASATASQLGASVRGGALGTAVGLGAGMAAGGPKTWARSGRQLKTIGRLARRAAKNPKAGVRQAKTLRAIQSSRPKTSAFKDPERRKDMVRGTVGGLVTGTSVNMAAAQQSRKTVARNPRAWAEQDRKMQGFVNKAIEPDVDPAGFLEQVEREKEALRDSGGRFVGRVVDSGPGAAIIATPYPESEEA